MKVKNSPLQILDYALTSLQYELIPPDNIEDDVLPYFKQYDVNIDFGLESGEFLKVFIKASVNSEETKLPGYSFVAEAACIFQFDKKNKLPDIIKQNLEGFSTIYIALNSLRGLIGNFTANAPFGRYILPSIDLNDLILQKKATLKKVEIKKPAKKSSKKINKVKISSRQN